MGQNALRFNPHFAVTSAEIDLIIDVLRDGLRRFTSADSIEAESAA